MLTILIAATIKTGFGLNGDPTTGTNLKKTEYLRNNTYNDFKKMPKESLLQTIGSLKGDINELEYRITKIIEHLVLVEEKYLEKQIQEYSKYKQKFENSKPFKDFKVPDFSLNQFKKVNEL